MSHDKPPTSTPSDNPEKLYDDHGKRWSRTKPNCLSDFTARPFFFESVVRPHIDHHHHQQQKGEKDPFAVLDLGCGEGYCTRAIRDMIQGKNNGRVIGIDLSSSMIELAQQTESELKHDDAVSIEYIHGDVCQLQKVLEDNKIEEKSFDLITAVFVFNYMTKSDMKRVVNQVYQLLKPNRRFAFTVPHPSLKYWDRRQEREPPFYLIKNKDSKGYFDDRDQLVKGVIYSKDGTELPIQSVHKTMSDYFEVLNQEGFLMERVVELGVSEEMMKDDPEFFGGVKGVPLHVAFEVIKPDLEVEGWLRGRKEERGV